MKLNASSIRGWARRRVKRLLSMSAGSFYRRSAPVTIASDTSYDAEASIPKQHYLAICSIMKNESQNILEWIAYHKALGVEKFYLYDNNSTDNVVKKTQNLIDHDLVNYALWPINPGQIQAYDHCVKNYSNEFKWIAFIDLDEFINPFGYNSIVEWLSRYEPYSAVAIQWLNFGPSGHDLPPAPLMIEKYTTRLPEHYNVHGHVKTIAKSIDFLHAVSPHAMAMRGVIVDEHERPVEMTGVEYSIQPIHPHDSVCLNHYYTRSRAEWVMKIDRGLADAGENPENARDPAWIEIYEREASVIDTRITRFAPATRQELEAFGVKTTASGESGAPAAMSP